MNENNISNTAALNSLYMEIKLSINQKLFDKGYITEEMYIKAKDVIIKGTV